MYKIFTTILGYLLFSFIGVPMAIAGKLNGKEEDKLAWKRAAVTFGLSMCNEEVEVRKPTSGSVSEPLQVSFKYLQAAHYDVSEACKQAPIKDHLLDVYLYGDRIERVLKVPTKPLPWQRSEASFTRVTLKALRPEQMRKAGLEFTLDCAIAHTRAEFLAGKVERACAKGVAVREEATAASQSLFAQPQPAVASAISAPVEAQTPNEIVKSSRGLIDFVGENTVHPKGRTPYTTYTVTVREDGGQKVSFSGVDLREKAAAMSLSIGDKVLITQRREEFVIDNGGHKTTQHKNVFDIQTA
jgi:hypothetical protein